MDEYNELMNKIRDLANKQTPVYAKDIGSDGHERWQCPCCGAWWYAEEVQHNYCFGCGHRIKY